MTKQHFFMRLIPPRPSFPGDMTEEEGRLMQEHATYTRAHFDAGRVLIYGPVLAVDPPGVPLSKLFTGGNDVVISKNLADNNQIKVGDQVHARGGNRRGELELRLAGQHQAAFGPVDERAGEERGDPASD